MSNTGRIKTAGKIKIQLSYLSYRSIETSTKQVCADSIILIIKQQLRIAELEKQLNIISFDKYTTRVAELKKQLNLTCF